MSPSSSSGQRSLVSVVRLAYHVLMEVIRSGKKEVVKFQTPSGVTAIIDTSISDEALAKFAKSLKAKLKRSASRSANLGPKSK